MLTLSTSESLAMHGTDADVHFINDWSHPVTVTRTWQTAMSDEYPETHEVAALTSSDMHYVSASVAPWARDYDPETRGLLLASVAPWKLLHQSKFNLRFARSTTTLYIGQGLQKTAVQSVSGPDYETGIVLAPANSGSTGADYNFFILSGPNLLAPLLNSFIQANLAWFCESLKSNPRTKTFGSLNLVVSALKTETLACTYATCVPAGNSIWKFNVIITFSGTIGGSLSWGDISNPTQLGAFEAKVTGLSALIQATLDFSDLSAPSFVFDTFQISLKGWDITETPLLNLITGPLLHMGHDASSLNIFMTAYRFAGLINSNTLGLSCNKRILQSINDMLAQELARIPKGAFPRALPLPKHMKQATQAIRDRWMSDPGLQAKKLRQIVLPATHDSQAYFLSDTLSQVPYSDIAFLWKLRPGARPVYDDPLRKEQEEREEPIFLGAALHAYVIRRVQFVARAQDREVLVQLSQGIRVFDLRIYHDSRDGEIWTQHCLRARQLRDIFSQVRHFLDQHHDSRELVFLGLSHLRRPDDVPHVAQVAQLAKDILGAYIYMPDSAEGEVNFDFSMLADLPLSQIVGTGPKVILLNGDHNADPKAEDKIYYAHSILNTSGFDPNGAVSLSQGCSATDMLFNILDAVSLNEQLLLKLTAAVANSKVKAKLAECPDANLVSLDWHEYHEDGSEPAVDVILRRNGVNMVRLVEAELWP
jgi:hypothetical protein